MPSLGNLPTGWEGFSSSMQDLGSGIRAVLKRKAELKKDELKNERVGKAYEKLGEVTGKKEFSAIGELMSSGDLRYDDLPGNVLSHFLEGEETATSILKNFKAKATLSGGKYTPKEKDIENLQNIGIDYPTRRVETFVEGPAGSMISGINPDEEPLFEPIPFELEDKVDYSETSAKRFQRQLDKDKGEVEAYIRRIKRATRDADTGKKLSEEEKKQLMEDAILEYGFDINEYSEHFEF